MYCRNCGKQLPDDAKFCVDCGTPVKEGPSKKRVEQAGTIYKCPNCGEVLESMTAICPACGYEIRNVTAVSSVQSFSDKLAAIEAEEMPETDNNSILKKVFGRDLRETPKRLEEARQEFNKQKLARKVNLIKNFPIPNTKEDLMEFTFLISTNLQDVSELALRPVWISKLEQVYQKAKILMPNDPAFSKIETLYADTKKKSRRKITATFSILGGLFLLMVLLAGFEADPVLTGIITAVIVGLVITVIVLKKRKGKN